jgi:hypothetical protein
MRKARFALIALVLFTFATPMFACIYCGPTGVCEWTPENMLRCKPTTYEGGCTDRIYPCYAAIEDGIDLASDYEVASVEVKHDTTRTVTTSAARTAVADASLTHTH